MPKSFYFQTIFFFITVSICVHPVHLWLKIQILSNFGITFIKKTHEFVRIYQISGEDDGASSHSWL